MQPSPDAPVVLGRYELVRKIGAGGMGEVFLARVRTGAKVKALVVKTLLPRLAEDPHALARFRDESNAAIHLKHANVARVYAVGDEGGRVFLAMEYVRGKTVSRLLRRLRERGRRFPVPLALLVGERVCRGLAYAHAAKDAQGRPLALVHRDISPGNVCVSYGGEVKIIDFGAAKSSLKKERTAPGMVIGSLAYMAPEQALLQPVDARADVYSMGASLWELLTGISPSPDEPMADRWRRTTRPEWEPPSAHRPKLHPAIDAVVMRALRSNPADRYPTAGSFAAELGRVRAQLQPKVADADLGKLLSSVYAEERAAEETLLRELLTGQRAGAEDDDATVLVPATAHAFEHTEVDVPPELIASAEVWSVPGRRPVPRPPPPAAPPPPLESEPRRRKTRPSAPPPQPPLDGDPAGTVVRAFRPDPPARQPWPLYAGIFVVAALLGMAASYWAGTR
ncbi:MAG TPA: serine/threonine-protein kinase [Myxococcaceae bacterium]|nr:serine/threonine-protein kinase [Myxococcaceae bacterium]